MKKLILGLMLVGMVSCMSWVRSAEPAPMYAVVEYMRVAQGHDADEYVALEKLWQRLHQKAVDAGICRGWYFSRVENGGANQFVTVRVYDSLDRLRNPWPDALFEGLFSAQEMEKQEATESVRHLTHREVWQFESGTTGMDRDEAPYIALDFMKPNAGKAGDYYDMEKNVYTKLQQARVDKGQMRNWYFMSRMFPSGTEAEYDFVTMNIYEDKAAAEKAYDLDVIKAALTPKEYETAPSIEGLREWVRREVWHPIARAVPAR